MLKIAWSLAGVCAAAVIGCILLVQTDAGQHQILVYKWRYIASPMLQSASGALSPDDIEDTINPQFQSLLDSGYYKRFAIRIATDHKAEKEVMDAFQLEHQRERPDFFMAFSGYVHPVNARGEYMDHFFLIGITFGTEWPQIHARLERIADIELMEYYAAFP